MPMGQANAALENKTEKRVIDLSCSPDWKEKTKTRVVEMTIPAAAEEVNLQNMNIRRREDRLSNKGVPWWVYTETDTQTETILNWGRQEEEEEEEVMRCAAKWITRSLTDETDSVIKGTPRERAQVSVQEYAAL